MTWSIGVAVVWVVGWAVLETWVAHRRKKRDPYAELNEDR